MASSPAAEKKKVSYFEHRDVLAALEAEAKQESERLGYKVHVSELIREAALIRANEHRKRAGKKVIDYDTSSGKFSPGGMPIPGQVVVEDEKNITVYEKRSGAVMTQWKKLTQLPALLRDYPRVKIGYAREEKRA